MTDAPTSGDTWRVFDHTTGIPDDVEVDSFDDAGGRAVELLAGDQADHRLEIQSCAHGGGWVGTGRYFGGSA